MNNGFSWLLVGVDRFKCAFTTALPNKNKDSVINGIRNHIYNFGSCVILYTDNVKKFVILLLFHYDKKQRRGVLENVQYCPWIRGKVTKLNKTLKYMISFTCNSENIPFQWKKIYKKVTYVYNNVMMAQHFYLR